MIAAAVLDLGPAARAAYITVSDLASSTGPGSGPIDDDTNPPIGPHLDRDPGPAPAGHLPGGGGMAPSGGNSSPSSSPAAGVLTGPELPADGLVVYFREAAASLKLSIFIDSILDPPRRA
jgi:hypothetical protein